MITAMISVILCFINSIKRRRKDVFIISLFFMWFVMSFSSGTADESVYLSRYNNYAMWSSNTELLFQFIIVLCNKIGLSFIQFKAIISFIYISLIGNTIWEFAKYPGLVLILFFLCPFPLNVTQLRFALASSIFIYSFRFLNNSTDNQRIIVCFTKSDIKYLMCICCASLIHSVSLVWALLILVKKISIKNTIMFTLFFNIFIIYIFNPNTIYWILQKIGAGTRMMAYFSAEYQLSQYRSYGLTLITSILTFGLFISACVCIKKMKINEDISLLLKIDIASLSVIGFILKYTAEMYRPQEALILINYIYLTNTLNRNVIRSKKSDFIIRIFLYCSVLISFILKIYMYNLDFVWKPLFF